MKNFTKLLFWGCLIYFSNITDVYSQDGSNTTVIVFEDSNNSTVTKTTSGKKPKKVFPKNNIKIGLLGAVYGEIPIYYERYLTDWLTVQLGAGITTRDFMGDIFSRMSFGAKSRYTSYATSWNGPNEYEVYNNFYSYEHRKTSVGYCVSLSPRFFVGGLAFEGFYLGPYLGYALRNYKSDKVDTDGSYISGEYIKEKTSSLSFYMNFGWQTDFQPVSLDVNFSVGFAKNRYTKHDIGYTLVDENEIYGNKTVDFNRLIPYTKLNLEVGGIFGKNSKKKKK